MVVPGPIRGRVWLVNPGWSGFSRRIWRREICAELVGYALRHRVGVLAAVDLDDLDAKPPCGADGSGGEEPVAFDPLSLSALGVADVMAECARPGQRSQLMLANSSVGTMTGRP